MAKKKIKDLTYEQIEKICGNNTPNCSNCPLLLHEDFDSVCLIDYNVIKVLNAEIEVEKNEKEY